MEDFLKFKKKILFEYIIKCALIGISIFSYLVTIFAILQLIGVINIKIWVYILICLAIAIAVSLVLYFIKKPTDMKIAKRLDKEFNLGAKMETMIEYAELDNDMAKLQRNSAFAVIKDKSLKALKINIGVLTIILVCLGFAAGSTTNAIAISQDIIKNAPQTPTDDITDTQDPYDPYVESEGESSIVVGLRKLIVAVHNSSIDLRLKNDKNNESLTYPLYELIKIVKQTEDSQNLSKEEQGVLLRASCLATIDDVLYNAKEINTNAAIGDLLKANAYTRSIGTYINSLDLIKLNKACDNFVKVILTPINDEGKVNPGESFGNQLLTDMTALSVSKDDELYKAVVKYIERVIEDLDLVRKDESFKKAILNAVSTQGENIETADMISTTLKRIFGIKTEKPDDEKNNYELSDVVLPERPTVDPSDLESSDDETGDNDQAGSQGTGGTIYGSNDLFYDPVLGEVRYGDSLLKYYAIIQQMINDGSLTEEQEIYFTNYFNRLFGTDKN